LALTLIAQGNLEAELGKYERADDKVRKATELAIIIADRQVECSARAALAEVGATARLADAGPQLDFPNGRSTGASAVWTTELPPLMDRISELGESIGSRLARVRADLAGGLVYLAQGDIAKSLERSARAI